MDVVQYHVMMNEPPKSRDSDEFCLMCKRQKSEHTTEEMLACSKKLQEFKKNPTGGAGIE